MNEEKTQNKPEDSSVNSVGFSELLAKYDPIQRSHQGDSMGEMEQCEDGEWVKYEDLKKLLIIAYSAGYDGGHNDIL